MGALSNFLFALSAFAIVGGMPAVAQVERRNFKELQYTGVSPQAFEPSCATASIVTILNNDFGAGLDESEIWLGYLSTLPPDQQKVALEQGLSIADIERVLGHLGYKAYTVRIGILDLARAGRPAIVYMLQEGPKEYRHFLVFDELDGSRVKLRDPALGARREHVDVFLQSWQGIAIFITKEAPT